MTNTHFLFWLMVLTGLLPLIPVWIHIRKHSSTSRWTRAVPRLLILSLSTGVLGLVGTTASRDVALVLLGAMAALWCTSGIRTGIRLLRLLRSGESGPLVAVAAPLILLTGLGLILFVQGLPPTQETVAGNRLIQPAPVSVPTLNRMVSPKRFVIYRDPVLGYTLQPGFAWFHDPTTLAALTKIETAAVWEDVGLVASGVVFPKDAPPDQQILRVLLFNEDLGYPQDSVRQIGSETRGDFRVLTLKSRQVGDEGPLTNYHHVYIGENVAVCITAYALEGSSNLENVSNKVSEIFTPGPARVPSTPSAWKPTFRLNQALRLNQVALEHYENQQFEASLTWCAAALEQSDDPPPVLLTNALLILNEMKRHPEALEWLERYAKNLDALPPEQETWYAWHLFQAGEREKGLERYDTLFRNGYRNNQELTAYLNLILEQDTTPDRALAVLKRYGTDSGKRSLLLESARLFRIAGHPDTALAELARLEGEAPADWIDPTVVLEKLYALHDTGRYPEALELADQLEAAGHADANLHYHRAQSLYGLKRYPEAKLALEAGLTLSPGNTLLLDDLRMVAAMMGQGENSSVRTPIDPLSIPEDLPVTLDRPAADTEYAPGGEIVADIHLLKKTNPRVLTRTVYRRIHITDRSAANSYRTLTLDFNPLSESIYVNQLRVLNPDGSVRAEADRDMFYIMDEEDRTLATFDKTLQIPVPQLTPGCDIEFVYTRQTSVEEGDIPFEFHYFAKFQPIRAAALVWVGDRESLQVSQMEVKPPLELQSGLAWIARDIPAYRWEALQGEGTTFLHTVILGNRNATWEQEATTYLAEQLTPRMTSSDRIREVVKEVTDGLGTPRGQVQALAGYVQRHCQYQGIEFGVRGRLPNFPDEVLARNFGDCKDHAILLVQFLREAGFKAWPTLVSTDSRVFPEFASLDQFDHMITCVRLDGQDVFIDTTLKSGSLLDLPPVPNGSPHALVLDPDHPRMVDIPRVSPDQNQVDVEARLEVVDGTLQVKEQCTLTGLAASHFRSPLHDVNPEDRSQWFHQHILPSHLQLERLAVDVEHLDDPEQPLRIHLSYTRNLPGAGQPLAGSVWDEFYLRPSVVPERRTPFRVRNPFQYSRTTHWKPDAPLEPVRKESLTPSHAFQTWRLTSNAGKQSLDVTIPRFDAAPEAYTTFQKLREDLLQASTIRVKKD